MLGALEFHVINANIFSWVESMRMCSNECFTLSLEDNRKIDGQKENKAVLIQVTLATSYLFTKLFPCTAPGREHFAASDVEAAAGGLEEICFSKGRVSLPELCQGGPGKGLTSYSRRRK